MKCLNSYIFLYLPDVYVNKIEEFSGEELHCLYRSPIWSEWLNPQMEDMYFYKILIYNPIGKRALPDWLTSHRNKYSRILFHCICIEQILIFIEIQIRLNNRCVGINTSPLIFLISFPSAFWHTDNGPTIDSPTLLLIGLLYYNAIMPNIWLISSSFNRIIMS